MRTITQNIYQFSELSPKAQEKAIDLFLEKSGPINDTWWKNIYSDALETADLKITGFDIDPRYWTIKAQFTTDAKSSASRVISEHGKTCTTYSIANKFLSDLEQLESATCKNIHAIASLEENYLNDISNEYLNILEREYDYLSSSEYAAEFMTDNDWEFYEDGRRYRS